MLKKILALSLLSFMLISILSACTDQKLGSINHGNTTESTVREYIEEIVPKEAKPIASNCQTQYRTTSGRINTTQDNRISAEAYTYCISTNTEKALHSVLAIQVAGKIDKNDRLDITINDYLLNLSPERGKVLSAEDQSSEWTYMRSITPIPTNIAETNTIAIFGSEIENENPYTLVLLSFPSIENPSANSKRPEYSVSLLHDDQVHIPLWMVILFAMLFFIGLGVIVSKRRGT